MQSKNIVKLMFAIAFIIIAIQHLFIKDWVFTSTLLALVPIPFIQNMAFTWVSRSRQGGDPDYHRYAGWSSNGVWLIAQGFIAANVYTPISRMLDSGFDINQISKIALTFLIYAICTTEGSVFMMKINLGKITKLPKFLHFLVEKGNRQVGKR